MLNLNHLLLPKSPLPKKLIPNVHPDQSPQKKTLKFGSDSSDESSESGPETSSRTPLPPIITPQRIAFEKRAEAVDKKTEADRAWRDFSDFSRGYNESIIKAKRDLVRTNPGLAQSKCGQPGGSKYDEAVQAELEYLNADREAENAESRSRDVERLAREARRDAERRQITRPPQTNQPQQRQISGYPQTVYDRNTPNSNRQQQVVRILTPAELEARRVQEDEARRAWRHQPRPR